jgi:hypothetical protein
LRIFFCDTGIICCSKKKKKKGLRSKSAVDNTPARMEATESPTATSPKRGAEEAELESPAPEVLELLCRYANAVRGAERGAVHHSVRDAIALHAGVLPPELRRDPPDAACDKVVQMYRFPSERVAPYVGRLREACGARAAPLPLHARCIDEDPTLECALPCFYDADDWVAFLRALLPAAFALLGVAATATGGEAPPALAPCKELRWPLVPLTGSLAEKRHLLAFLPADDPVLCLLGIAESRRTADLRAALGVGARGGGPGPAEVGVRVVLDPRAAPQRQWSVATLGAETGGEEGPATGAYEHTESYETADAAFARAVEIVEAAVRAAPPGATGSVLEVCFPGWLTLSVPADQVKNAGDLKKYIHAAFADLAQRQEEEGGVRVRMKDERVGTVALRGGGNAELVAAMLPPPKGTPKHQVQRLRVAWGRGVPGEEGEWEQASRRAAEQIFRGLERPRQQASYYVVSTRAVLRFRLPFLLAAMARPAVGMVGEEEAREGEGGGGGTAHRYTVSDLPSLLEAVFTQVMGVDVRMNVVDSCRGLWWRFIPRASFPGAGQEEDVFLFIPIFGKSAILCFANLLLSENDTRTVQLDLRWPESVAGALSAARYQVTFDGDVWSVSKMTRAQAKMWYQDYSTEEETFDAAASLILRDAKALEASLGAAPAIFVRLFGSLLDATPKAGDVDTLTRYIDAVFATIFSHAGLPGLLLPFEYAGTIKNLKCRVFWVKWPEPTTRDVNYIVCDARRESMLSTSEEGESVLAAFIANRILERVPQSAAPHQFLMSFNAMFEMQLSGTPQ